MDDGRQGGGLGRRLDAKWAEGAYPWREKLAKFKGELGKGVWGYWELGAWKPLGLSARKRGSASARRSSSPARTGPTTRPAGRCGPSARAQVCDRISAEKRANTVELMKKMPQMLLDYKRPLLPATTMFGLAFQRPEGQSSPSFVIPPKHTFLEIMNSPEAILVEELFCFLPNSK
ncbi:hypothetical protein PR202_ga11018 [Eleusine coracana subsp. coracana]|uniref:Uncharacterized protein n=1 Tax=Eleusine coracana subsp. coracana TaxID=191504 RepID=A0AAV5C8G8_ELECO|nr:hypothetical protein PR202_ga11018 [Eleusine coracana subsp. coracana]